MSTNSNTGSSGPVSPYDPFPTPRIFPDKWDLSELVSGYHPEGDPSPATLASTAEQDPASMTDGFADESTTNAL
jgi:hypothetical protein